ncbi:TetR/AcrR family transcriptional regulator [Spelaeicoccus albus]|uniref:AcrR family transcriptional regulator n=1 Tax=Spelaeicoccus albus TaxID=1280376 RepID=A0A7Z0IJB6_9MICO|nr:TetR/AcrR family transcriptional regulator [Spelaeicoccus albus]NYI69364.1 AcrR family transcriptional regulator [Spelaeicoccus albus]
MPEILARPQAQRVDAARNRARLLEVARAHLLAGNDLPLNTIAREAAVGVGTAYRHFPNRATLLEALAIDAFEALLEQVSAAIVASGTDTAAALRGALQAAFNELRGDAALAKILSSGAFSCADTAAIASDLVTAFTDVLARARREGLLREDVGPDDLRRLLCGLAAATHAGTEPVADPSRYLEILVAGLRPH